MEMLLIVFSFMILFVLFMSVGLIIGRKPITGSCGGMSAVGMESACDVCGGDKDICDTEVEKSQNNKNTNLGFEAR